MPEKFTRGRFLSNARKGKPGDFIPGMPRPRMREAAAEYVLVVLNNWFANQSTRVTDAGLKDLTDRVGFCGTADLALVLDNPPGNQGVRQYVTLYWGDERLSRFRLFRGAYRPITGPENDLGIFDSICTGPKNLMYVGAKAPTLRLRSAAPRQS